MKHTLLSGLAAATLTTGVTKGNTNTILNSTSATISSVVAAKKIPENSPSTNSKNVSSTNDALLEEIRKLREDNKKLGEKIDKTSSQLRDIQNRSEEIQKTVKKDKKKVLGIFGFLSVWLLRKEILKFLAPILGKRIIRSMKRIGFLSDTISLTVTYLSPESRFIKTRTAKSGSMDTILGDKDVVKFLKTKLLTRNLKEIQRKVFSKKETDTVQHSKITQEDVILDVPKWKKWLKIGNKKPEVYKISESIILKLGKKDHEYFTKMVKRKLSEIDGSNHTDVAVASDSGIEVGESKFAFCAIIEDSGKKGYKEPELIMCPKSLLVKIQDSGFPQIQETKDRKLFAEFSDGKVFFEDLSQARQYESYLLLAYDIEHLDTIPVPSTLSTMLEQMNELQDEIKNLGNKIIELESNISPGKEA